MSDDLFSQLFDLFNQPGPVNLKLAAEVARHLVGEKQAVDPFAAEEFRELTRLAEFRVEQQAPFAVGSAPDVLPVDAREWAERNLEGFGYLAEPFAGMVDLSDAGPAAGMLSQLGPAMAGMQVGTLVGSLARFAMASFDTGLPVAGDGPITFVVPTIDRFTRDHDLDPREVRLWVALNETTHRAMFRVPFALEHLSRLVEGYASTMQISPDRLMGLMQGLDPNDLQSGIDPSQLEGMLDSPEVRDAQAELIGYLGLTAGYRRLLVERAAGELLPSLDRLVEARDAERHLGDEVAGSAFAATFVDPEDIARGKRFCEEVERRYGPEELTRMFTREGRFPLASELDDPVAWAARVLLDELEG